MRRKKKIHTGEIKEKWKDDVMEQINKLKKNKLASITK